MAVAPEPSSRLVSASAALRSRGGTSSASTTSVSVRDWPGGSMGSVGGRLEVFVDPGDGASGSASPAPYRSAPKGPEPALVPPQRGEDAGEPAPVPLPTGGDAGEPAPVPPPTGGDTGDSAAPRPAGDVVVGGAGSSSAAARSRPCLISAPNLRRSPGAAPPGEGRARTGSRDAAPTDLAPGQPDTEGAPRRPRPRDAICACATKSYRKSEAAGAVRAAGCGIRSGKVVAFTDAGENTPTTIERSFGPWQRMICAQRR
jgi:hypothetical protein